MFWLPPATLIGPLITCGTSEADLHKVMSASWLPGDHIWRAEAGDGG